ncbi:hypothetical protein V6N13_018353 [Hibiscus sabdariffa]
MATRRTRDSFSGKNNQAVTIYVNNIPEKLHWKGLWQTFGRHGEVSDTFIANKKNKEGRSISSEIQDKKRQAYWKKVNSGNKIDIKKEKDDRNRNGTSVTSTSDKGKGKLDEDSGETKASNEMNQTEVGRRLRIRGHSESEDLWKLKSCLVGEMPTVCATESVRYRLQQWGMGDIKVKRLGGKSFILWIEDKDLYKILEDLQWSYLKEIFSSIRIWSENDTHVKRATCLELTGVPIHCWNDTTFKRLIQNWGEFEAFGENLDCSLDCEKMKILITTQQVQKICEVVELEVGSMIYEVRVSEIGFSDPSSNCKETIRKEKGLLSENIEKRSKSESTSSSEGNRCNSPIESVDRHTQSGEEELNAAVIGNRRYLGKGDSDMGKGRSLGECDLVGVNFEKNVEGPVETAEKNANEDLLNISNKSNTNWAELLFKNQLARNENESEKVDWEVGTDSLGRKEPNPENLNPKSPKTLGSNPNRSFSKNQIPSYTKGAVGRSGGILSIWDKSRFKLESTVIDPNFILLHGKWLPEKTPLIMVNVYAPCQVKDQEALWERISLEIEKDKCCKVLGAQLNGKITSMRGIGGKLKVLKGKLKQWNISKKENFGVRIKELENRINALEEEGNEETLEAAKQTEFKECKLEL